MSSSAQNPARAEIRISRPTTPVIVHLQRVTKGYAGMKSVLRNCTMEVRQGEFLYLTGVSGAGKTTVFKLLLHMERPDQGKVIVCGEDITALKPSQRAHHRRRIGMVFQDVRLLEEETVEQNIALTLHVAGVPRKQRRKRIDALLDQVGLSVRRRSPVITLSGGEKQLVGIARALVFHPAVFLADEPTGNLDPDTAQRVMNLITQIHRQGCTVIVATHDLALLRTFRARTLLIRNQQVHEVRLLASEKS